MVCMDLLMRRWVPCRRRRSRGGIGGVLVAVDSNAGEDACPGEAADYADGGVLVAIASRRRRATRTHAREVGTGISHGAARQAEADEGNRYRNWFGHY